MNVPEELRYSSDHEWARLEGSMVRIGITDYAQDALGDVVYVKIPEVGQSVASVALRLDGARAPGRMILDQCAMLGALRTCIQSALAGS